MQWYEEINYNFFLFLCACYTINTFNEYCYYVMYDVCIDNIYLESDALNVKFLRFLYILEIFWICPIFSHIPISNVSIALIGDYVTRLREALRRCWAKLLIAFLLLAFLLHIFYVLIKKRICQFNIKVVYVTKINFSSIFNQKRT